MSEKREYFWNNVSIDGRAFPSSRDFSLSFPKRSRASVEVDQFSGSDRWRLAEQTDGLRFTGIASKWTCRLVCCAEGVKLHLYWQTPDRGGGDRIIELIYHDYAPASDHRLGNVVAWVHDALRLVFLHEADEAIVLRDGTRPFDPHATARLLQPLDSQKPLV